MHYHHVFVGAPDAKYQRVLKHIDKGKRILEIGCHSGYFLTEVKKLGNEVVGIDNDKEAIAAAQSIGLNAQIGDIENPNWVDGVQGKFDLVLLLDVLEHLKKPEALLNQLKQVLNPAGKILVTVPNIAYWAVRKDLLMGKWEYKEAGILDRTHLRFYNQSGWAQLFEKAGLKILVNETADSMLPFESGLKKLPGISALVDGTRKLLSRTNPNFFSISFLFSMSADS